MPIPPDLTALTERVNPEFRELFAVIAKELNVEISFQRISPNIRPVHLQISQENIDLARLLGGGNVSAGLRVAIKVIATAMQIKRNHSGTTSWSGFMGGRKE